MLLSTSAAYWRVSGCLTSCGKANIVRFGSSRLAYLGSFCRLSTKEEGKEAGVRSDVKATPVPKYPVFLVANAFLFAVFVSLAQFSANPYLSASAFDLAYVAFPFLIFSIFLAVVEYSWPLVRQGWRRRSWKLASWLAGVGYVLFYIFATNTINVPDPGISIPSNLSNGYLVSLAAYGPMAVWPDVEFYSPIANLTGYLSVGNVMLFVSLAILTTFAVSLLIQNVSAKSRSRKDGAAVPLAGAVLAALSTNACCCCTPLLLPVLALFFGGSLSTALAYALADPVSPLANLLTLATLASLLVSIILSTRRCRQLRLGEQVERSSARLSGSD